MPTGDQPAPSTGDIWVVRTARPLIDRLLSLSPSADNPVFVGIDGRSGAGKSSLADAISNGTAAMTGDPAAVLVIEGDQFYAGGSGEAWDRRSVAERADRCIDWRRQRVVLEQLRSRVTATWHPFDWAAADWDGDVAPFEADPSVARVAPVIVLEGAYSCRPELHDLLDVRVLLDVPRAVRRQQLLDREGDAYRTDWEARWSAAEDHYFDTVMSPDRFDMVIGLPEVPRMPMT